MAEEAGNVSSADNNRACSNGRSRKNRGSNNVLLTKSKVCSKEPT